MPEPFSAEHLNQLRQRWERDPKSRAFLQLAEEYRRAGRLSDAVHVLQAGLKEHPTYLSAQVALGRCLVESGAPDAAVEILERAVARDPTQLVANKLLVEAYLGKGQAEKARERLDLYKLFNDRDADIEPLEARIRSLLSPPTASAAAKRAAPREARDNAPFALPAPESLPEMRIEPLSGAAGSSAATSEPFGALYASGGAGAVRRIESAFAEQGIFALVVAGKSTTVEAAVPAGAATEAAVEEAAPMDWEAASWPIGTAPSIRTAIAEPEPAPAPSIPAPAERVVEVAAMPPVAAVRAPEPPPPPPPPPTPPALPPSEAPRAASATLGELYLAQGHLAEAEESFQSVLRTRPGDTAALAGLESVRMQRGDEAAAFADEIVASEESNVIVGGLTARKAALLKDYLARIRRGVKRHVS